MKLPQLISYFQTIVVTFNYQIYPNCMFKHAMFKYAKICTHFQNMHLKLFFPPVLWKEKPPSISKKTSMKMQVCKVSPCKFKSNDK